MVELKWCKNQKKGIKLIQPNENLCKEYIQTAEETLDVLRIIKNKSNVWLATTKYYCEYFAIYALLMKIGVKSEIHECTIKLSELLEKERIIPEGYSSILLRDKQLRIDNQYYLKNKEVVINYSQIVQYVLKIKDIINKLSSDEINKMRRIIMRR